MKAKQEYDVLVESGELLELYPELSGSWRKDKKSFTEIWEKNLEAINDEDDTLFNEFDEYDEFY